MLYRSARACKALQLCTREKQPEISSPERTALFFWFIAATHSLKIFIYIITPDLHNDSTSIIFKLIFNLKKVGYGHNTVIIHWKPLNIHHRRAMLILRQKGVHLCGLSVAVLPFHLTGCNLHTGSCVLITNVLIMKRSTF